MAFASKVIIQIRKNPKLFEKSVYVSVTNLKIHLILCAQSAQCDFLYIQVFFGKFASSLQLFSFWYRPILSCLQHSQPATVKCTWSNLSRWAPSHCCTFVEIMRHHLMHSSDQSLYFAFWNEFNIHYIKNSWTE